MARRLKARNKADVLNRDMSYQVMGNTWFINPRAGKVRVIQPRVYQNGGFAVIRIWPMLDPTDPNGRLLNGRINSYDSAGLQGMSMSEAVPVVQYLGFSYDSLKTHAKTLGLPKSSVERHKPYQPAFITAQGMREETDGVPVHEMPYQVLFRTAERLSKAGQEYGYSSGGLWNPAWDVLFASDDSSTSVLTPPKSMVFVVCSVYENGEEFNLSWETRYSRDKGELKKTKHPRNGVPFGEGKDDPLVVMAISATSARRLMMLCNEENEEFNGDPEEDLVNAYRYGDPTGVFNEEKMTVDGGLFFHLYNSGVEKFRGPSTFDYGDHQPGNIRPYDVGVSRSYSYKDSAGQYKLRSSLNTDQVNNILSKHLFFWPDPSDPSDQSGHLLRVSPVDEQAVMIAKALAPVPDFLKCVWSETSYLSIKGVSDIVNRKTVSANLPAGGKDTVVQDTDDDFVPAPKKQSSQTKKVKADFTDLEDEQDELLATTAGKPVHADVSDDELFADDDDDDDFPRPAKDKSKARKKVEPVTEYEDDNEIEQDDEFDDDELEDLDDADDLDADDGMQDDDDDDDDQEDFSPASSSVAMDDIDDLDALEQQILGNSIDELGVHADLDASEDGDAEDDLPTPVKRALSRKRK